MARQTARSAEQIRYDGTTEAAWQPPDLSDYAEAMDLEGVETTGDLSREQKRQIAAMTLLGEARASRFDELQSYPVVEPTGELNRNALDAARRLRGQSSDPEGIERVTRQLLNFEWDADIEKPGKQATLFGAPPTKRHAEHGAAMLRLPPVVELAHKAMQAEIDEEDLHEEGLERDPHVTAFYPVPDEESAAALSVLEEAEPITLSFGATSVFENSRWDVLKVDVESEGLRQLHNQLNQVLDAEPSFEDFSPHLTIAYLQPGAGKEYTGMGHLEGVMAEVGMAVLSDSEREQQAVSLKEVAGVDTTPPQYMQDAARQGLERHEEGLSGDGLEGATVREGQRMADGEPLTANKIQKGFEFWARNTRFCNEDASEEQVTSALLWGGCDAPDWFERKHDAIEEARSDTKQTDMLHPVIKAAMEDLSEDTLVSWDSAGGTAYGRIDMIATGETVSGSLEPEDVEHETSDENPGLIIQLIDRTEDGIEGRTEDGEPATVFHRPDTVTVVEEGDVPMKSRHAPLKRVRRGRRSRSAPRSARKSREDTLIARGMGLKTLTGRKADGTVKVGGYGIVFTGPDRTDLDGQYFTRESDFWLDGRKDAAAFPIYSHGMDEVMGLKRFSDEPWTAKVEDAGVWMEGQIEIADEYDELLVEEGIKPGKMGLSTGVPPHLVQTSRKSGAEHIDTWPFGEVSITPQPAEPDTRGLSVEGEKSSRQPRPSRPTSLKSLTVPTFHDALGLQDPDTDMPMKARSTNDKLSLIHDAFRSKYDNRNRNAYIQEVFMEQGFVVAYVGDAHFRIPMEMSSTEVTFANESEWEEVVEDSTWVPVEEMEDGRQGMGEDEEQAGMAGLAKNLDEMLKEFEGMDTE